MKLLRDLLEMQAEHPTPGEAAVQFSEWAASLGDSEEKLHHLLEAGGHLLKNDFEFNQDGPGFGNNNLGLACDIKENEFVFSCIFPETQKDVWEVEYANVKNLDMKKIEATLTKRYELTEQLNALFGHYNF